jgi:putative PIN family toxin of toxin-antitoxin system
MRLVVDANVFISAFIARKGVPGRLLARLVAEGHVFLVSEKTMEELRRTLAYPKIRKVLKPRSHEVEQLLSSVEILSEEVNTSWSVSGLDCRDPKDIEYLAVAIAGHADYIVSGDNDLLVKDAVEGIQIITPAQLLSRLLN